MKTQTKVIDFYLFLPIKNQYSELFVEITGQVRKTDHSI